MVKRHLKHLFPATVGAITCALAGVASLQATITGQWDFDSGNLTATAGPDITYGDTATQTATQFGTTTALGIPGVDGQEAKVMKFPATGPLTGGYSAPAYMDANGGGSQVNQWTLVMDVLFPAESNGKWRALADVDMGREFENLDGDFFVNTGNGIGISGQYNGQILPDTWHRVALVVDQSDGVNQLRKYIDGIEVGVQGAGGVDGRWGISPYVSVDLFADNDGDVAMGYVNSIQLHDTALTKGQMFALGAPSAAGIPAVIPPIPSFVASTTPAYGDQNASAKPTLEALIDPGSTTVTESSVTLYLDGSEVAATVAPNGGLISASYLLPALLAPESEHTALVEYTDSLNGAQSFEWPFKVAAYKEVILPDPIVLETFDSTAEGSLPPGWVVANQSDSAGGAGGLDDYNSDEYKDWTVISRDRLLDVFGQRRLDFNPVVVNGEPLASLVSGNLAYAESDHRGGNQVQYLTSPDFNCSGKTHVYLGFYSSYEQNQDSLGAVEYSIDSGNTWLPALYMVEQPDFITDVEGNVDAVATLGTARGDQAGGLAYGDYIGAPVSEDLAPFISARVNDDQWESKRVEVIRLVGADNQSKVRLRFLQTGTGSWYFGIDNVGLYSITQLPPEITQPPPSQVISAGSTLLLEVVATGTAPLQYQWLFEDAELLGETSATLTVPNIQTANAGRYSVRVDNVAGTALSPTADVAVFSGPIAEDLVVHLKLDGDYADASGRGNDATANGSPTFVGGRMGTAAHLAEAADYLTLGKPADLDFATGTDFSIAFWTHTMAEGWSGDPSFIGNKDWNSGGNQGYVLATDGDGHFQWNLAGPPGGRKDYDGPAGTFTETGWRHVVVTFDRTGPATTYIDGQVVDSRPLTANANDLSTPTGMATNIGQDGTGTYSSAFNDLSVDDVGIWRRLLTPQEVAGIYEAGLVGADLSTVSVVQVETKFTGISRDGNTLTLTWTGGGTLQSAPSVNGPWTDVAGAVSPHQVTAEGAAGFFRLKD